MGKLAIIGLGLIGGSIGLALRRYQADNTEVVGFDTNQEVMGRALKAKVVNATAPTVELAVRDATMVIVATPIITIRKVFQSIAPHLQRGALVTDTASTKGDVLRWADEILPKTVYFVGGHPMAGKEKMGLHFAEAELFDEKPYAIVPAVDAVPGAVNAVVGFVEALGAKPMYFDADEHDSYVAAISHLPLLTSVALFNLARGSNAWPELASLSGSGFRDTTRLASGEAEMAHDIFLTNKDNVLHWLNRYIGELHKLSDLIENKEETQALFRTLTDTQMAREKYTEELPERDSPVKYMEVPSSTEAFMSMLTGTLWQQRAKEVTEALQEQTRKREEQVRMRRRTLDDED